MNVSFVYPPQHFGEMEHWLLWGNGPASYSQAGDPILGPGVGEHLYFPSDCTTQSGNYSLTGVPSATDTLRPSWSWIWKYSGLAGLLTVSASGTMAGGTPGTYTITSNTPTGGTPAVIQIVVLTATTYSQPTLISRGSGFTAAPTFTNPAGLGTGVTITATAAPSSGSVPNGTNLSAETVQFSALGGQL